MTDLLVEKYRPKKIEDVLAPKNVLEKFDEYIQTQNIPHLLFHGQAGIGKTTVAKILAESISDDVLYINASDETSVDVIRGKVSSFCSTVSFSEKLKIVILDEFDGMSEHAMRMLRNTLEAYYKHCRFILTCNYVEKIISPIRSRCQEFEFGKITRTDVAQRCAKIMKQENIEFTKEDIKTLVNLYYPDIRKIINNIQKNCKGNKFTFIEESILDSDDQELLINLIKQLDVKRIRKELLGIGADYIGFYRTLFNRAKEYVDDSSNVANVMIIVADHLYRHSIVVDKEINFVSCLLTIMKNI